jgi:large subunit ribosomal protein L4
MYQGALRSVFSELIRQQRLVVVEQFPLEAPKTRALLNQLKVLNLEDVLIVTEVIDNFLTLAARNLYKVRVTSVTALSLVDLIGFEKVLVTLPALKKIEEIWA